MSTKVLLLTQWFDPEPTSKGLVFAKELVKQGFEVEVVTGFPNYPGGKIYPGYKISIIKREVCGDLRVTRLALYPSHNGSALKRIVNYLSFALFALSYCLFFAKRPDVIYAYHPPLTVGLAASVTRFFRKIPVVYDIQDMWPDTLRATGMLSNQKALAIIRWLAKKVYKHSDQLVVLSPGFKKLLIERGVPAEKIEVIPNWCDENALEEASNVTPANFPGTKKFTILFAGNMGKAQALDSIISAADLLKRENANIQFIFLGGGVDALRLKDIAHSKQLDNVFFLPPVPMSDVGSYLKQADALLVHLKKDSLFNITIPSKTQAYMAMGKPIIMGVEGDAAAMIENAECGIIIEPENVADIAHKITLLARKKKSELLTLGDNGKNFYWNNLSLFIGASRFSTIFTRLAKSGKSK